MKKFAFAGFILFLLPTLDVQAKKPVAPTEVLSDIRYMKRGGVDAVRVDFAIPVHYLSHYPAVYGDTITINIKFDHNEVPDVSELPLLQTLLAPPSDTVPLEEVTYLTEEESPKLLVKFKRPVQFNISQVMGITNLVIFLPKGDVGIDWTEYLAPDRLFKDEELPPGMNRARKMLAAGRQALKTGDNKKAIQVFSALLSQTGHTYMQESLELLGVARERNNQIAHAKSVYQQYIAQYADTAGATRVKQRIADLISNQLVPRKKLKKSSQDTGGRRGETSKVYANIGQFVNVFYTEDSTGGNVDKTELSNQVGARWRLRKGNFDVKSYFYANYDYDTVDGDTRGAEVNSMYTKIKNVKGKYELTLGRQSASTAGVLSKFDGVTGGYDIDDKLRVNAVYGYPIDLFKKSSIQTSQPFMVANIELDNLWEDWDISPYVARQEIDGIVDRFALGGEARYFHKKGDFFSLLDYDVSYSALNLLLLRGQYKVDKRLSFNANIDVRKNPLLETNNATIGMADTTVGDLINNPAIDEDDIRNAAEDRTGDSKYLSIGLSQTYSEKLQVLLNITRSEYVSKFLGDTTGMSDREIIALPHNESTDTETDILVQFILSRLLEPRDSLILIMNGREALTINDSGRDSESRRGYNETILSAQYRRSFAKEWRLNTRLKFRKRYNDDGEVLQRWLPAITVDYRHSQALRWFAEFVIEHRIYSGTTRNEGYTNYNLYMGYTLDF